VPYGIGKKYGGDSPVNDAHMEAQVAAIMKSSGVDKVSAIKIAKAQMAKRQRPATLGDYLDKK
jgi:hypothetical protein